MPRFRVFNRLFVKGKPTGRKFIISTGSTREEARQRALKANIHFNTLQAKEKNDEFVRIVEIKEKLKKQRKPRSNVDDIKALIKNELKF